MPRNANDPYRELFEGSAHAILIIDGDTFVDCNQSAVDMLRYGSKAEVLRTHPSDLSPPRQPDGRASFEKANEMIGLAFARGSHRFEWDHQRADGTVFPVEVLLTVVPRSDGHQILHTVWRDITARRRLEEELRQAQMMEAIGKLAGGIAHDFNNLLVSIIGHADLLRDRLREPQDIDAVDQIIHSGELAADLVRQLMAFSRKQELRPRVVDLFCAVTALERLLSRVLGEEVGVELVGPEEPVRVLIDPVQLEQVVVNLATNARDAMEGGGTITLTVSRTRHPPETLPRGSYGVLDVSDTGPGMAPEVARRAFEPFFTTKPEGQGTGLGLATVYGIAQQAGGLAMVVPGEVGTTIRVVLPETFAPETATPVPMRRDRSGGHETILLVEDEETVADLVSLVLRRAGYRVLVAEGAEAAMALWGGHDGIDLLLTDVVMPKMGGPALVSALAANGPVPRVLYMSGYTADRLAGVAPDDVDLLAKPFTGPELLARVRRALER